MTASGLSAVIVTNLNSFCGTVTGTVPIAAQKNFADALATAIVNYIQSNAVVSTTDAGTVTSGPGLGGTVAATGTGTVS
jgi:tRNA A37 threonylcarbamoyltransferase TsaD